MQGMRQSTFFLFLFFHCLLFSQNTDLRMYKNGNDVSLSWTNGVPDYVVTFSTDPSFTANNSTLNDAQSGSSETHTGILNDGYNYFYDVAGQGEDSRAQSNGGYIPPPAPELLTIHLYSSGCTSTEITYAAPGDIICLHVKNPDVIWDSNNIIDFPINQQMAGPLTDNGDGTWEMAVTIPDDEVSGNIAFWANGMRSNEKWLNLIVYDSFQDISSLAFEDSTGSLWVGDRGTADDLIEIDTSDVRTIRAGLGQMMISDFDSDWQVYYSNSLYHSANQGTCRRYDSINEVIEDTRKIGELGDPVQVLALAVDKLVSDQKYASDGYNGTIRRVPQGGSKDYDYGSLGYVNFNDPAGLRMDSSGSLYATTWNNLYRIDSDTSTFSLLSDLSGGAGIDLTETNGILISEEAGDRLRLASSDGSWNQVINDTLNSPVAVVEGNRSDKFYSFVAEPTRIMKFPSLTVAVQPNRDIKMLISAVHGFPYPEPILQDTDGQIKIKVYIKPPQAASLYLKAHDPPDRSPYMGGGAQDDNECYPPQNNWANPNPIVTDSLGYGETTVTIQNDGTNRNCAGDNFYFTLHLGSLTNPEIARTGIITLWKRIYVERDKMFRSGSFLSSNALSGATSVEVENGTVFGAGDKVQILDDDNQEYPFGDILNVDSVAGNIVNFVAGQSLSDNYTAGHSNLTEKWGYVGLIDDASNPSYVSFYETPLTHVRQLFDPAFIEVIFPSKGAGPIPNPEWSTPFYDLEDFSLKWWHPDSINGQNYLHLMGCEENPGTSAFGHTPFGSASSLVYVKTCENSPSGDVSDTTLHELVHNFMKTEVNNCLSNTPPTCYHCNHDAYIPPNDLELCEMNISRDRTNGILRFCTRHIIFANDYGDAADLDESVRRQNDAIGRTW